MAKKIMMWTKRAKNSDTEEEYAGNADFVRQEILPDDKVLELKQEKWVGIQQQYPNATTKSFEEFWKRLWNSWVREKKKLATRQVNETRRKHRQKPTKTPAHPSDDSPIRSSISTAAPNNRT